MRRYKSHTARIDSYDLGIDRGMRVEVLRIYQGAGMMDVYVPALDMVIVGVTVDHPDLEMVQS